MRMRRTTQSGQEMSHSDRQMTELFLKAHQLSSLLMWR